MILPTGIGGLRGAEYRDWRSGVQGQKSPLLRCPRHCGLSGRWLPLTTIALFLQGYCGIPTRLMRFLAQVPSIISTAYPHLDKKVLAKPPKNAYRTRCKVSHCFLLGKKDLQVYFSVDKLDVVGHMLRRVEVMQTLFCRGCNGGRERGPLRGGGDTLGKLVGFSQGSPGVAFLGKRSSLGKCLRLS